MKVFLLLSCTTVPGGNYPENGAYEEGKGSDDYGNGGGGGGGGSERGAALNSAGGGEVKAGHGGSVDGSVHSKHKITYSVVDSHSEVSRVKLPFLFLQ